MLVESLFISHVVLVKDMFSQSFNFKQFSDTIFTSGMPTKEQLLDSVNFGIQVVINLAPHTVHNALQDEQALVSSLHMEYINIPVDWNTPTRENLTKFMDSMDELPNKVVYVHCQANFRASSFVSLYGILRKGWDTQEALQTMYEIWNTDAYPIWKEFIAEFLEEEK